MEPSVYRHSIFDSGKGEGDDLIEHRLAMSMHNSYNHHWSDTSENAVSVGNGLSLGDGNFWSRQNYRR